MENFQVCGAGGDIRHNKNYRLIAWYNDRPCILLRFSLSKDGSINFSPYIPNAHEIADQLLTSGPDGSISVDYGTGVAVAKEDLPGGNILKINYHASGHIHYGARKAYATSLRGLNKKIDIAAMMLMHPLRMGMIERENIRNTDMVTGFRISDQHPAQIRASVAPTALRQQSPMDGRQSWTQMLICPASGDVPEIALTFHLFDTVEAPWPPECGVFMQACPENSHTAPSAQGTV